MRSCGSDKSHRSKIAIECWIAPRDYLSERLADTPKRIHPWWGIRANPNPRSKQGFCAQIFNAVFQNSPALMILLTANGNEHHRQLRV